MFIFFELIVMIFLVLWVLVLLLEIFGKPLPVFSGYIPPIVSYACHFLGFLIWATKSDVKFRDKCEHQTVGLLREDLCVGAGAALALFILLIMTFLNVFFVYLWNAKGKGQPAEPK